MSVANKQSPVAQYFSDIWGGIRTTYLGMQLTLRYCFGKTFTMRYPEERPIIPPSHRGEHKYDESKCIFCNRCVGACPTGSITIETAGRGKDALCIKYDVDYSSCLFCNMCVEACPADCLWLTEKYNLACGSREACLHHYARPKTGQEIEAHKAMLAQKEAERKAKREAERLAKEQQAQQQPPSEAGN